MWTHKRYKSLDTFQLNSNCKWQYAECFHSATIYNELTKITTFQNMPKRFEYRQCDKQCQLQI